MWRIHHREYVYNYVLYIYGTCQVIGAAHNQVENQQKPPDLRLGVQGDNKMATVKKAAKKPAAKKPAAKKPAAKKAAVKKPAAKK